MTIISTLLKRRKFIIFGGVSITTALFYYIFKNKKNRFKTVPLLNEDLKIDRKENSKLNLLFFKRLKILIKIIFPKLISKEYFLLVVHTSCLMIRTFISIYVANLDGKIVRSIVEKKVSTFIILILKFLIIALPATFINSLIRFLENKLSISFRSRLVDYFYTLYFKNQTYYRVENVDCSIKNIDQSLTEDIAIFSKSLAHLYSQLTKPLLDICLMSFSLHNLAKNRGGNIKVPFFIAISAVILTGEFLRLISPKFGTLVAEEARRKGYLRFAHSRVIQNSEEIAFYSGEEVESEVLKRAYTSLIRQINKIFCQKLWYIMIEQFLMKYVWSAVGMCIISIPILTATGRRNDGTFVDNDHDGGVSERTQLFTMARNLLVDSAAAVERIISSYKEIIELSGYTSRVYDLLIVFNNLSKSRFYQSISSTQTPKSFPGLGDVETTHDFIELINVPIITPNGDIVAQDVSLRINKSDHILITGPNGCGKSSLFRIFHGLWPIYGGKILRPDPSTMYHIPQKPYMFLGSLRDQIIYPDSYSNMRKKGVTDQSLRKILEIVQLEYIITREGGLDAEKDWVNVFSGGEKQRIGMSRLFYHKPQFALLDECTSAVSIDVEANIYETAKQYGMTLLTITHRPSLRKFHKLLLEFDGEGRWTLSRMAENTQSNE